VKSQAAAFMVDAKWAKIQQRPTDEVKAKLYEYEQVRPLELREAVERYRASLLPDYLTKTMCVGGRIICIPKTRTELMSERRKQNRDTQIKRMRLWRGSWAPKAGDYKQERTGR
jgi:hypothetical protein